MPYVLLVALREFPATQEALARSGIRIIAVMSDSVPELRPIAPEDIALLISDMHTGAPVLASGNDVAMKPRRPRVKRKGGGLPTPADNEREYRNKEKQLTKYFGSKGKQYNRIIGKK